MKYLLLLVLVCSGCGPTVKEDTMTIYSIDQGNQEYKYLYTIRGEIDSRHNEYTYIKSNKEFRVGDKVELKISQEN